MSAEVRVCAHDKPVQHGHALDCAKCEETGLLCAACGWATDYPVWKHHPGSATPANVVKPYHPSCYWDSVADWEEHQ